MRVFVSAIVAALSLTGCTQKSRPPVAASVIRVGEFASLSGSESSFGLHSHRGVQMAIQEANARGGILHQRVELVTKDDKGRLDITRQVVEEMIRDDGVVAVIGEVASDRSLEGARVAQKHGIPLITPNSSNPRVTEVGPFIFRVCYTDPFQGLVMAKFAREVLKLETVAIFKDADSEYSRGLSEFFYKSFVQQGGKVVLDADYRSGETEFGVILKKVKTLKPQALFLPGYYNEVSQIARRARQMKIEAVFLGGDGWDSPRLYEVAGAAMAGSYFSNHFSPESTQAQVKTFVNSFRERFNTTPDGVAAQAYDATRLLLQAIERGRSTEPERLRQAIATTIDFQGVTGKISITENRNAIKPAVILKVAKDSFKYVTTVSP